MRTFTAIGRNGATSIEAECEIEAEEICEQRGIKLGFHLNRDHPGYAEKQAEWERIKERRRQHG